MLARAALLSLLAFASAVRAGDGGSDPGPRADATSHPAAAGEPAPAHPPDAASELPPRPAPASPASLAVLDLSADPGEEVLAKNLAGLVTARLATYPLKVVGQDEVRTVLGFEKARAVAGCEDDSCLVDLGDVLGVRYLVHGALGKVGRTYVLRLTLSDLERRTAVHRAVRKEEAADALIPAAESAADELAARTGLATVPHAGAGAPPPGADGAGLASAAPRGPSAYVLNIKLGNTFASLSRRLSSGGDLFDLSALNLNFDLEGDWYFTDQLAGFLQIGVVLGTAQSEASQDLSLTIVPAALGVKLAFMPGQRWSPYAALGVGAQGMVTALFGGGFGGLSLAVSGTGGVEYVPWPNVGFNLEASFNLANLAFAGGQSLQLTLIDLNFGVLYLW